MKSVALLAGLAIATTAATATLFFSMDGGPTDAPLEIREPALQYAEVRGLVEGVLDEIAEAQADALDPGVARLLERLRRERATLEDELASLRKRLAKLEDARHPDPGDVARGPIPDEARIEELVLAALVRKKEAEVEARRQVRDQLTRTLTELKPVQLDFSPGATIRLGPRTTSVEWSTAVKELEKANRVANRHEFHADLLRYIETQQKRDR